MSESLETKAVRRGGEAAVDVPAITIILPTVASRARGRSLIRAFESIRSQQGVRAVALVVANGPRKDPGVLESVAATDACASCNGRKRA